MINIAYTESMLYPRPITQRGNRRQQMIFTVEGCRVYIRSMMKAGLGVFLVLAFTFTFSYAVTAGQLDDFEKASTKNKTTYRESSHHDDDEDEETGFWDAFFGEMFNVVFAGIFDAIAHGGHLSLARINGSTAPEFKDVQRRDAGSPELPYLRAEGLYHLIESDIEGVEGRIEAGYGPFGIQFRSIRFREDSPDDSLTLTYVHGLYRVSGSSAFEVDAGIGSVALQGESRNSGPSVTFPVTISPHPNVSLRFVPTWSNINGNDIADFCGSVSYVHKFISLSLGYERIEAAEEVLQGPFAGVSLYY